MIIFRSEFPVYAIFEHLVSLVAFSEIFEDQEEDLVTQQI